MKNIRHNFYRTIIFNASALSGTYACGLPHESQSCPAYSPGSGTVGPHSQVLRAPYGTGQDSGREIVKSRKNKTGKKV